MPAPPWGEAVRSAVADGSPAAILRVIKENETTHAQTPPAAFKRELARLLALHRTHADLIALSGAFLDSQVPGLQEVGALLFADVAPDGSRMLLRGIQDAAASDHWEVREWAASAFGEALAKDPALREEVGRWSTDPSERLRRAAVIALMELSRAGGPEAAGYALDVLGMMLADSSPYVQKNLGAFAIGSSFAAHHPDLVVRRMRNWVANGDELVRTQVALVFTAAAGARLAGAAGDVLARLAADPRPRVQRALRRAEKVIARHAARAEARPNGQE